MSWTRDWDDDDGGSGSPWAEEQVDLDWTAWLRTRLEAAPQLEPAEADGAVTEEVQGLHQAVEALARERDREVLAGLHALRTVVDALVEVVAGFPEVVRQALDVPAKTTQPPTVHLDESQLRAIAAAVADRMLLDLGTDRRS